MPTITAQAGRSFACFPVAVIVVIVNDQGRILLLSRKGDKPGWQVIAGALEAGETVLEGALRETREEAGSALEVQPLGVAHTCTFRFDDVVREMIDVVYVMSCVGGEVVPGSDMAGSRVLWATVQEIRDGHVAVHVPGETWFLERALQLWQIWRGEAEQNLEPTLRDR